MGHLLHICQSQGEESLICGSTSGFSLYPQKTFSFFSEGLRTDGVTVEQIWKRSEANNACDFGALRKFWFDFFRCVVLSLWRIEAWADRSGLWTRQSLVSINFQAFFFFFSHSWKCLPLINLQELGDTVCGGVVQVGDCGSTQSSFSNIKSKTFQPQPFQYCVAALFNIW